MDAASGLESDRLTTERLVLAPFAAAHAPALFPLLDDWHVVRMLAQAPWPLPYDSAQAFAEGQRKRAAEADSFTILLDDAPIGIGSVKRPGTSQPPRIMPRLGFWIGRPYWGGGLGTEAVGALTAYAFARFASASVIGGGVFSDNPGSRRLLEKLGFREARLYTVPCRSRGEAVETVDMLLTREAWEAACTG